MKKFLLFFIFILLFGCDTISKKDNEIALIDCPAVFFSTENNFYSQDHQQNINIDNYSYNASLNNYAFLDGCFADLQKNNYFIDILLLVESINLNDQTINLPIFVLLYDMDDQIIDKQYFRIQKDLNFNKMESDFQILEITDKLRISIDKEKILNSLEIGFIKINQ